MKRKQRLKRWLGALLSLALLLALLPGTAPAARAAEKTLEPDLVAGSKEKIIVSLGDSYSSGEGIPDFYGQEKGTPGKYSNYDWLAHRSTASWPGRLRLPSMDSYDTMANHRDSTWYFAAASGAVTDNIRFTGKSVTVTHRKLFHTEEETYLEGQQRKDYSYFISSVGTLNARRSGTVYLPGQLDIFNQVGYGNADYVTMTIGGNDAEFSKIVTDAVLGSTYLDLTGLPQRLNDVWRDYYKAGGIRDNMRAAYQRVADAAGPQATIIIAGYPELLDRSGKGVCISQDEAVMIDDAVLNFNKEIQNLVTSCAASGMNICFVPVAQAFENNLAYSHAWEWGGEDSEYLNRVMFGPRSEDLDVISAASAYSMHPNDKGAQIYADCVNEKLKELEENGGKPTEHVRETSDIRDVVLVLDTSGSMDGYKLRETKEAACKFVDTVLQEGASVAVVSYDDYAMKMADFSMDGPYLQSVINNLITGGSTNTDDGLQNAEELLQESHARKRIIVLMSDGEANEGRTDDALTAYANELKDQGIIIYTLGFFDGWGSSYAAQRSMEGIASPGCHFEVDEAENLQFFFEDVADQLNGTPYIYVRVACPVDVEVTYNGETLSSNQNLNRTSFGSLTYEDGEGDSWYGDNRTKILRLREGVNYQIDINGNGEGTMNYTVRYMDGEGEYTDVREIKDVEIRPETQIRGNSTRSESTKLWVDYDGDGRIDDTLDGGGGEPAEKDLSFLIWIGLGLLVLAAAVVVTILLLKRKKNAGPKPPKAPKPPKQPKPQTPPAYPGTPVPPAYAGTPAGLKYGGAKKPSGFCGSCGAPLDGKSAFCGSCGAKVR